MRIFIPILKIAPGLCFILLAFMSKGQQTQQVSQSGTPYLQFLPADYNVTTKKYPVIIVLHGTGERGTNLNQVLNTGISKVIQAGSNMTFKAGGTGPEFSFIVMSPQITGSWSAGITDGLINHAINNLRGDPSRIYLTGFSLGGNGTWIYAYNARNQPSRVAAIAPIAGWGGDYLVCPAGNYDEYSVWGFHGDADATITIDRGQKMINAYNACVPAADPQAKFTIYPGVGHNSWDRAYRPDNSLHSPNLYEWFLLQKLGGSPSANAGADQTLTLPTNSTTIIGSGSDPGGSITGYQWTKISGPAVTIANATTTNLSLSGMVEGIYEFSLTVTDNEGNTAADNVIVTVNPAAVNQPPTITALATITLTLPTNSTNIIAVASDVDGTIASYLWTQQSGPSTATLAGTGSATLGVSALIAGTYTFRLLVSDDDAATATRDFTVIVNPAAVNQPPSANAGSDKSINLPTSSTNLIGSGSDPDGTISTYLWTQVNGPAAVLSNTNTSTLTVTSLVAGVYNFRLTVTDNQGSTASDDATVTVVAANQSPVANAGSNFSITLPTNSTNINGSGNDPDGSIANYLWTQISGPNTANLTNATLPTVTASNLIQGLYTFRLTVTDNQGSTGSATVSVTVNAAPINIAPVSNAGTDQSITLPTNSVVIAGSGTDADGSIASYSWTIFSGPAATLTNQNTPTLSASNLVAGTYVFRLTVTDNQGATGFDNITVTVQPAAVNQSPLVDVGPDFTLTLPTNSTDIFASSSDPDGSINTHLWEKLSGPAATLSGVNTATLSVSAMVAGTYVFRLTVTDNLGATASDDITIIVAIGNQSPVVVASDDETITLPTSSTNLIAVASDPDGSITNYLWTNLSGPAAPTLAGTTTNSLAVSDLIAGTYVFRITVTDNEGATSFDEVNVTVQTAINLSPTANAGSNKSITLPTNSTNFTGSGNDSDGTITNYQWTQVSGSALTLANSNTTTLTVSGAVAGSYIFRLTVLDNNGATGFDDVTLTVNPAAINQPPTAEAGANQTLTLPVNSTTLVGIGSDPDGSISTYQWTKISGPTAVLTNPTSSSSSIGSLVEGTYLFRLTVTDNGGLSATDDITINVLPQIVNQAPIANAGPNQSITLPTNSITLFGSGSDADGSVSTYLWTKVSGPAATLTNANTPTLSLTNLLEGIYVFQLTVSDNLLATGTDQVTVTVNALATNQTPIAFAGTNQTINLPTNSVNLNGSGSDPDGSIASYLWTKISGPACTLTNSNQAVLLLSNLVEGTYILNLMVTDNDGATANDDVTVFVLAATTNQSPVVDAGPDISMVFPINSVEINGSVSDADGLIVTYLWTKVSGGAATLTNADQSSLSLTGLVEGTYIFRLTATDDDGAIGSDNVTVVVQPLASNTPPLANAGADQTLTLPTNSLIINGIGNDAEGAIASYEWLKVSGPSVTIANATTADISLTNMIEGTYIFRLTVTDGGGLTGSDEVTVTVFPQSFSQSPIADAGPDIFLDLPSNNTTLNGTGTDTGSITAYLWTAISGPSTPTLTNANTQTLTVSDLEAGTYILRLTVTDNDGLTAFDEAQVIVSPQDLVAPVATPPVANAGEDIIVDLPATTVSIVGSGTDDGIISTFQWSQISGTPLQLTGLDNDTLTITSPIEGEFNFELTVTDDENLTDTDQVKVTIVDNGESLQFPFKLISPNGDGQNDFWILDPDPATFSGCIVEIYNRRGSVVYESNSYANDWGGTINGEPLPQGAYHYVVKCQGKISKSGSITIIR